MTNADAIRKAAILVSLLDSRSADALLDPMDVELSAQVRQAVMDLDDVSEEEQEQVLADFFGRGEADLSVDAGEGVEIELSSDALAAAESGSASAQVKRPAAASPPALSFLGDVPPIALAEVLTREHPQTVAVIVASLPPEHAGGVLEHLPPALATEALSRMAWLTPPVPEALADLAAELRRRLAHHLQSLPLVQAGVSSVRAILDSLPQACREQLLDRIARRDERLARGLHEPAASQPVQSYRYRLNTTERPRKSDIPADPDPVPLVKFDDLAELGDADLRRLAASAPLQTLTLALLAADDRFTRRMLAGLGRAEAADFRSRQAQPGPLRLKDIDQAQQQIAALASELAQAGQIPLPISRRLAAAA